MLIVRVDLCERMPWRQFLGEHTCTSGGDLRGADVTPSVLLAEFTVREGVFIDSYVICGEGILVLSFFISLFWTITR